jgi:pilus assembly protein TadC
MSVLGGILAAWAVVLALGVPRRAPRSPDAMSAVVSPRTMPRVRPRITAHRRRNRASHDSRLPEIIETIAVGIASGLAPATVFLTACDRPETSTHPALRSVATRLRAGDRFADAVGALRDFVGIDAAPVVDLLVAADRDGLPIAPLLDRLVDEARQQERRRAETASRRLPVRLAAPLVVCTLPGFVLLAVVPLVAGALSSLAFP